MKEKLKRFCLAVPVFIAMIMVFTRGAFAVPLISEVMVTDVTTKSFSVVWISNEAGKPDVKVFDDPEGNHATEGITLTPHPIEGKNTEIVTQAEDNGVMKVRITGLMPEHTYYFQTVTTSKITGEITPYPGSAPFLPVTTEKVTKREKSSGDSIVPFSNNLLIKEFYLEDGKAPASGTLAVVNLEGASYPVSSFIGDGVVSPYAVFDLNNIYSVKNRVSYEVAGDEIVLLNNYWGILGNTSVFCVAPLYSNTDFVLSPLCDDVFEGVPKDGAKDVHFVTSFSWNIIKNAHTYSLYLWKDGEEKPDLPVASDLTEPMYTLQTSLHYGALYHWQITVKGTFGEIMGSQWSFTTATPPLNITSFSINNGASSTTSQTVTLNNTTTGNPTEYMASESSAFTGATWQTYSTAPNFTLSAGNGDKTVYFKVKNASGESAVVSDNIVLNSVLDTTAPEVSSTVPTTDATNVPVDSAVTATFSEAMDIATITNATFIVNGATGIVTYSGMTATFAPTSDLAYGTTYTATITTGVMDLSGNAMISNYTWSFTTAPAPDTTPPEISSTNPPDGAITVAISDVITATFSEEMDAATINTTTFVVSDGSNDIDGTVAYSDMTATFTPSSPLAYSTTYTATITTGVTDEAGNAMTSDYTWGFSTGSDIIAHYAFDEGDGSTASDSSGNGNDGTIDGATWTTGKEGGGLSFDGVNDYVTIPLMNNGEVSVSAWFYKNAHDKRRNDAIFSGFRNSSNLQLRQGFEVRFPAGDPNTLEFVLVTQDGSEKKTAITTRQNLLNAVGSWYHVVGTYSEKTGQQMLYVNGELVKTVTHPAGNTVVPLAFYPDMLIGHSRVNSGYFNGVIDDVLLYGRAITEHEVKDLYHAFPSELQARYNLDEGLGTIAGDSSGNGNHGKINGGAKWTKGRYEGGLRFDGTNDYVSIPRSNHDEVSVCAWFKKNANDKTRNDAILGGYKNNSKVQLREGIDVRFPSNAPNTLQFVLVTQDGSGVMTMRTAQWNLGNSVGRWHHLACTYSKATGKQRLYVNGVLVSTQTHPAGNTVVPLTKYPDMRIGYSRVNAGYFKGVIDDARIYHRALTAQEVLDIYNNP